MALSKDVQYVIQQMTTDVRKWTVDESRDFLEQQVKKDTQQKTEDQIKSAFVPANIFDESIFMTTTALIGPQGMAKTTTARYWASALTDDWLHGSIFRQEPLIVFTNSLRMGIKLIDQRYDGHDYIFLFIDDAIRHQSSKNVFSVGARRLVNDLAEIRHILEDECSVEPPCFLNLVWATQRFKELGTLVRSCDRAVYKGLATLGGDKDAIFREVGPEAYHWLLQINRMVKSYHDFTYLNHFVLMHDPELPAEYCVVDCDRTKLYEYPLIKDDFEVENITRIVDFVIRYFESDPSFPQRATRSMGIKVIKATIRKHFPDVQINMQEVIDEITFRYYKAGKYNEKEGGVIGEKNARVYKYRHYKTMTLLKQLMDTEPEKYWMFIAAAGYSNMKSLQNFLRNQSKNFTPYPFENPPPLAQIKRLGVGDCTDSLTQDMKDWHEKRKIGIDGMKG